MEKIDCSSDLLNIQEILEKISELNGCCVEMSDCCDTIDNGMVIRALLVENKLYLTSDGSAPVAVPFVDGDPIKTFLNTDEMKQVFFNKIGLLEIYLMRDIVFKRVLKLDLPQYAENINLRNFINANNPDNIRTVLVSNRLIQPSISDGNLGGLDVTLTNNIGAEFQGISSGGDAVVFSTALTLLNYGWIKGAGGDGGNGGGFDAVTIPSHVGNWHFRDDYDDGGPYVKGVKGVGCVPYPGPLYNRFWKTAGGANSGGWITRGCTSQVYWDTNASPIWGDQGKCQNLGNFRVRHNGGGGKETEINNFVAVSISSGNVGKGGSGIGFRQARNVGLTTGLDGYYSGPASGFDANGKNLALPAPGAFVNGDGGEGGDWADNGSAGTQGGEAGSPGGRAIVGFSSLKPGSIVGNVIGLIV